MSQAPVLVWFRDDLRLADNPALSRAAAWWRLRRRLSLHVAETPAKGQRAMGAAAGWWLAQSLRALDASLRAVGNSLVLRAGTAEDVITDVVAATGAGTVLWNRRYDGGGIAVDKALKAALRSEGLEVASLPGNLLREPWEVKSAAGDPMKVFSPFWRAHQRLGDIRPPLRAPQALQPFEGALPSDDLASWDLEPTRPNWASAFPDAWTPGEAGAQDASPPSWTGESPATPTAATIRTGPPHRGCRRTCVSARFRRCRSGIRRTSRRGWIAGATSPSSSPRSAGANSPTTSSSTGRTSPPTISSRASTASPGGPTAPSLRAWQRGLTGYPLVDAGMRELWQTGWMHNRVRMVVASFLVKNLLIDWRAGESWFWDTLVDADVANNPASWQWVAGSGADAAPYFRIFNPILQGEKFDPRGDYVRRWVPELAALPAADIHAPWQATPAVLAKAGVRLGETYPAPVVDHDTARERALAALAEIRETSAA
jgi:deoxyribodipyrimidine photo-lyase